MPFQIKIRKSNLIWIVLSLILTVLCFYYLTFKEKNEITGQFNADKINNGDIIFRRGKSVESLGVCLASKNMDFSHVGIINKTENGLFVLHIVPDDDLVKSRVRYEQIEEFLHPDNTSRFAVFRSNYSPVELNMVTSRAFDFFRSECLFDNKYNMSTDQYLYCTELVVKSLSVIDSGWLNIRPSSINLGLINKSVIMPVDLLRKNLLKQIDINQ